MELDNSPGAPGASSRGAWEVAAVLGTGALHLFFEEVLHAKGPFIVLASAGWILYVAAACRRAPGIHREWGLRIDGLGRAFVAPAVFFAAAAAGLAAIAAVRGTLRLHPHLLPLLALYPFWGLVQQFLVQAMVARNLEARIRSPWALAPFAAVLFAFVHLPDLPLMGATFGMGLILTPLYLKGRNLLPLGLCHGWLGALFYFWILARDPWLELFPPGP